MKTACAVTERGFTLLELSVVLVLIGTLTAMGLVTLTGSIQATQYNRTVERMDAIEKSLLSFAIANGRIPCPSDLTIKPAAANYGAEAGSASANTSGTCHGGTPAANFHSTAGVEEGGLPTRVLSLPDSYQYDGWGNRFRYAVDPTMTLTAALPAQVASLCTATSASAITVNDSTGAARTTAGMYALISHGANGHGAYTSNGVAVNAGSINHDEQINCHCSNTGAANGYPLTSFQPAGTATGLTNPTYVEKLPTLDNTSAIDNFDDIVTFKESWQMQAPNYPLSQTAAQCIYVADANNNRVQMFNSSGSFMKGFGAGYNGVSGTIGSTGNGNGQFNSPSFIHTDPSGNFWVGDKTNERIQKFDSGFNFLLSVGGAWCNPPCNGSFFSPYAATIDATGNIWVVDSGWNRVQEFNSSGTWQANYGQTDAAGDSSPANGKFGAPQDIVFDASGNFYVADEQDSRVEKFNSSGIWQSNITANLSRPWGMVFDSGGNLWVTDLASAVILEYNSSGSYVTQWGTKGNATGQIAGPYGIAIDASGNFWIADYFGNQVEEFSSSGVYIRSIGAGYNGVSGTVGSPGSGNGQFNGPYGITIGSR